MHNYSGKKNQNDQVKNRKRIIINDLKKYGIHCIPRIRVRILKFLTLQGGTVCLVSLFKKSE